MLEDDVASNKAIGSFGASFLRLQLNNFKKISVLTHCNTGRYILLPVSLSLSLSLSHCFSCNFACVCVCFFLIFFLFTFPFLLFLLVDEMVSKLFELKQKLKFVYSLFFLPS